MGKTAFEIVQEYFPEATEDFVEYLVWHRTSYPAGSISGSYEQDLREACIAFKEAKEKGITLCDFCNKEALQGKSFCAECEEALKTS